MGALACISVEDALVCQVLKDDVVREVRQNLHWDTFYLRPLRSVNVKRNVKMEVFAQNFSKIGANVRLDSVDVTVKNQSVRVAAETAVHALIQTLVIVNLVSKELIVDR